MSRIMSEYPCSAQSVRLVERLPRLFYLQAMPRIDLRKESLSDVIDSSNDQTPRLFNAPNLLNKYDILQVATSLP